MSLRAAMKWTVLDHAHATSQDSKQRMEENKTLVETDASDCFNSDSDATEDDYTSFTGSDSQSSEDSQEEGETEEEAEDKEEEETEMSEIQVDFEYYPIQVGDRSAIQTMLVQLLEPLDFQLEQDKKNFNIEKNLFELSTILTLPLIQAGQALEESRHYGSTVKSSEEEAPLGLLTLIAPAKNSHAKVLIDVLRHANPNLNDFIALKLYGKVSIGWILKLQSVLNMPPQVALPLYKLLLEEMRQDPEELQCDYYILIARTYYTVPSQLTNDDKRSNKKRPKSMKQNIIEYYYSEDALLAEFADFSCQLTMLAPEKQKHAVVPDAKRLFSEDGAEETRQCFILSHANLLAYVNSLEQAL